MFSIKSIKDNIIMKDIINKKKNDELDSSQDNTKDQIFEMKSNISSSENN